MLANDLTFTPSHVVGIAKLAYTVAEVAELTGFSRDTVTRLFERERGVLVINRLTENRKRRYRSIRIRLRSMSASSDAWR